VVFWRGIASGFGPPPPGYVMLTVAFVAAEILF